MAPGTATTFSVWDVEPGSTKACPRVHLADKVQSMRFLCDWSGFIDGCGPLQDDHGNELHFLGGGRFIHGFVETLDLAYNHHLALVLRPDEIWILIVMAFSQHINIDPEKYRSQIVNFEGKEQIIIFEDALVPGRGAKNDWMGRGIFRKFSEKIKGHIGDELHKILVPDFTTTTEVDTTIAQMVLMNATQAYFEFEVHGQCGIPSITLMGTLEDWVSLRQSVETFGEFGLEWWLEDLRVTLDEFVKAASGQPDVCFWKRIFRGEHEKGNYYKPQTNYISGWVHAFFPYLVNNTPNHANGNAGDLTRFYDHRVDQSRLPTSMRETPFLWKNGGVFECIFAAGFMGCVAVDDVAVRPQLGFCVVNNGHGKGSNKGKGKGKRKSKWED